MFCNRFFFHDTELYGKAFEQLAKTEIFRKQNVKVVLKQTIKI